MRTVRLLGIGEVSLEEFEAMLSAYVNAGAPRPVLEGTAKEKVQILQQVAARGDSQMRAVVKSLLSE